MPLQPPSWKNHLFVLDLSSIGDEAFLHSCLKVLRETFGAKVSDRSKGPGAALWDVEIGGVKLGLVRNDDGDVYLCSPDRSNKGFIQLLTKLSEEWPEKLG